MAASNTRHQWHAAHLHARSTQQSVVAAALVAACGPSALQDWHFPPTCLFRPAFQLRCMCVCDTRAGSTGDSQSGICSCPLTDPPTPNSSIPQSHALPHFPHSPPSCPPRLPLQALCTRPPLMPTPWWWVCCPGPTPTLTTSQMTRWTSSTAAPTKCTTTATGGRRLRAGLRHASAEAPDRGHTPAASCLLAAACRPSTTPVTSVWPTRQKKCLE